MSTISEFAKGLKQSLRESGCTGGFQFVIPGHDWGGMTGADPSEIDWEELDKEIDAFCAEFKARERSKETKAL